MTHVALAQWSYGALYVLVISVLVLDYSARFQAQTVLTPAAQENKMRRERSARHWEFQCCRHRGRYSTGNCSLRDRGRGNLCVSFAAYGTLPARRFSHDISTIPTYRGCTSVNIERRGSCLRLQSTPFGRCREDFNRQNSPAIVFLFLHARRWFEFAWETQIAHRVREEALALERFFAEEAAPAVQKVWGCGWSGSTRTFPEKPTTSPKRSWVPWKRSTSEHIFIGDFTLDSIVAPSPGERTALC